MKPIAIVLVALMFLAAGCGGSKHEVSGPLSKCESELENQAEVNAVRYAFNAGLLGTPDQLASNQFKGFRRSRFLDSSGHLRPYQQLMVGPLGYQVLGWVHLMEGPVRDDSFAAAMRARAHTPCKHPVADD
ncbi:MAG TPA: hypothetical protein VGQ38_05885 [Gaiellaceae bacterium]|nr:hypothetical protein [Gaiellaceae bacterium]